MSLFLLGLLGSVLVGFVVTALFTRIIRGNAWRWRLLDEPVENRKIHPETMPTGGGVAIALGVFVGAMVLYGLSDTLLAMDALSFWIGAFLLVGAGFWDDKYHLDPKAKFVLQIVSAYLLLQAGTHVDLTGIMGTGGEVYSQALYTVPLSMIWVVGIINAVNLIDGLDGLAAGVTAIAFLACAALFGMQGSLALMVFGIMVAGTLGAFLLYNFKPASIFMGDSGSLFLGYLLAGYTLQAPLHPDPMMALLVPVLLLGVPVLDTGTAILRRLRSRRPVFAPDRSHIHHQLVNRGTEKGAVLILYLVAAWFGSAALLVGVVPATWGYGIAGGTAFIALAWVWRLGCLDTDRPEQEEKGEVPAPQLLVWKGGTENRSSRVASSDVESVDEGALV